MRTIPWPTAAALILGGALSVILVLLIVNSGSSRAGLDGGREDASGLEQQIAPPSPTHKRRVERAAPAPLAKLVGQRFMVGLVGSTPSKALLEDAAEGMIGGILLLPRGASEAQVADAVGKLQTAAAEGGNPPLLIAVDQEGGIVKRFPAGPPSRRLAAVTSRQMARIEGARTGSFLEELQIGVDLAPVVDLGLPGSFVTAQGRTISARPGKVSAVASAFADGLQQTHTLAVAKHFPGLGSATANTDLERSEVTAGVGASLRPYRDLIRDGVKGVMVSTAIYSSIDPQRPAAWSPKIVRGLLRRKLGFRGLVLSDDLSTTGVNETLATPAAATAAARVGVDILMIGEPESFHPAYEAVLQAAEEGKLPERQLAASYARIREAKEWVR